MKDAAVLRAKIEDVRVGASLAAVAVKYSVEHDQAMAVVRYGVLMHLFRWHFEVDCKAYIHYYDSSHRLQNFASRSALREKVATSQCSNYLTMAPLYYRNNYISETSLPDMMQLTSSTHRMK